MAATPRKRNARGHGSALRHEIVRAATGLIDEVESESDVTLRSIARAAGVSAPAIYAHFPDRDTVLDAVTEASWEEIVRAIVGSSEQATGSRDLLMHGCLAYIAFARRHPLRYTLMTQRTGATSGAHDALDVLTGALARCRGGEPDDSGVIAAGLSTALHGMAMMNRMQSSAPWIGGYAVEDVLTGLIDSAISFQPSGVSTGAATNARTGLDTGARLSAPPRPNC
ncbi:TetR/AcrR family transcriptional regulator [Nocardia suismassiliense]|uniref:TetR/AcrR family transcriptional regulator n=1 Tax=Nocardia suismassiliense TaxID=2077092 RepID=UPI000D1E66DF|nr:TetR/AcrR family transcriptional regulator [Nocardia suismassiliense]